MACCPDSRYFEKIRFFMRNMTLILLFFLVAGGLTANAQQVLLEKSIPVSKEAEKGYIAKVFNDDSKKEIYINYRVRAKSTQVRFITYTVDYDFNLKGTSEEVIDLEKELPEKYRPAKYRKDKPETYTQEGLSVEPSLTGTLVLKRKVTTFTWKWALNNYDASVSVEGKLKASTDDDKKLFYHGHVENDNDGTAMILAGEKGNLKSPFQHMMSYHLIKYDINLKKLADVTINFDTPQAVAAVYGYPESADEQKQGMIVVFAPFKEKRYAGPKIWSGTTNDYTFVHVSYDGKLKDRVAFKSPNSIWRVDDFVMADDGSVYFYGPANDGTDDYFHSRLDISGENEKWPNFQLAKVSGGKTQFVSSTSMQDFKSKLKAQPDGKKGDPYSGRRVAITRSMLTPDQQLILAGQNYDFARNAKAQVIGRSYQDLVMFHFDAKGQLLSQYSMNKKEASLAPDFQIFEFSPDAKTMYWSFFDNIGTRDVRELDLIVSKPLGVPKLGNINLTNGNFEKYTEYGNGENFVHYGHLNYLRDINNRLVTYMGENKKGNALWFARVQLGK